MNTPISRARIAAGKLWGSWTFVAWLAALALPFLAVGTLWGGSAVPTVVAAVLFNVVIGFVLSSVSLGFSGLFGRSLTAYLVTGAFLFAWVVVVPMLGGLVTALGTLDKEATNLLGYVTWYHHPFAPLALLGSADWRMNTTGILGKLAYCLVVWTLLGLWGIRQATRALKRDVY